MARPRTIDREQLLDVAEQMIAQAGPAALTFGSLANATGLAKASVQSVFHTREELVESLLLRWVQHEQKRFEKLTPIVSTLQERVACHLQTLARASSEENTRLAAMLAMLVGSGVADEVMTDWYRERVGNLEVDGEAGRRARIAFLAAEGAFFMRYMAGYPIDDPLWSTIFDELYSFVAPHS